MNANSEAKTQIDQGVDLLVRRAEDFERRFNNAMIMVSRYAAADAGDDRQAVAEAYTALIEAHSGNFNTPSVA